jgi:hypothetical protein
MPRSHPTDSARNAASRQHQLDRDTEQRKKQEANQVYAEPTAADVDDVLDEGVVILVVHTVHDEPVEAMREREEMSANGAPRMMAFFARAGAITRGVFRV